MRFSPLAGNFFNGSAPEVLGRGTQMGNMEEEIGRFLRYYRSAIQIIFGNALKVKFPGSFPFIDHWFKK